jgi:hypothetical protein
LLPQVSHERIDGYLAEEVFVVFHQGDRSLNCGPERHMRQSIRHGFSTLSLNAQRLGVLLHGLRGLFDRRFRGHLVPQYER